MRQRPSEFQVLLVDEDPGETRLVEEALEKCQHPHHVHRVHDALGALAFISKLEPFVDVPRPDLVIVDLNLSGIDGYAVLRVIKRTEELQAIPVVALSTSEDARDVQKAYDLHANCYIVKPSADSSEFVRTISSLVSFWTQTATLPQPSPIRWLNAWR